MLLLLRGLLQERDQLKISSPEPCVSAPAEQLGEPPRVSLGGHAKHSPSALWEANVELNLEVQNSQDPGHAHYSETGVLDAMKPFVDFQLCQLFN